MSRLMYLNNETMAIGVVLDLKIALFYCKHILFRNQRDNIIVIFHMGHLLDERLPMSHGKMSSIQC